MVTAALATHAEATAKAVKEAVAAFAADQAKAAQAAERPALVAHVVAHSAITQAEAEAMDFAALKVVANGLRAPAAVATFGGRPLPALASNSSVKDEDIIRAMSTGGVVAAFQKKKEAA